MSRRLRDVLSEASKYDEASSKSSATKLKDLVTNAEKDYHNAIANKMAEAYGYTAPNKVSWEKPKGGKRKTRGRKTKSNRKSRRNRKRNVN